MARGLLTHIPFGNVKAFGYFREHGQIKSGMAFDNLILVLQKIAGEGGVADDIRAAVMTIARGISLGTAAPTPSVRQRPWRQERSRGNEQSFYCDKRDMYGGACKFIFRLSVKWLIKGVTVRLGCLTAQRKS